jgi:hypothetical protein
MDILPKTANHNLLYENSTSNVVQDPALRIRVLVTLGPLLGSRGMVVRNENLQRPLPLELEQIMISETWENISKDKLNSYIHNNWNAYERVLSNCRGRGHSFRHLEQDARIIQIAYSATPESCLPGMGCLRIPPLSGRQRQRNGTLGRHQEAYMRWVWSGLVYMDVQRDREQWLNEVSSLLPSVVQNRQIRISSSLRTLEL